MGVSAETSTPPGPLAGPRPRILIFVDYYLPGFKFGGPIRTLSNMVGRLCSLYEFFIFTADRDLGDAGPYKQVSLEEWNSSERAAVYYTRDRSLQNIVDRILDVSPVLIYLNSFFSRATMRVLFGRKLGMIPPIPVLLSPRGEFADGALAIKPLRKWAYIHAVNATGLLKGITLMASSELEKKEIESRLSWARSHPARVVPNLSDPGKMKYVPVAKRSGSLKILFLSRISRNKNLAGALTMLEGLKGRVEFSICGPIGDPAYYSECEQIMWRMPQNISVRYLGDAPHDRVADVLAEHHLMFLPTHGENFGHAIAEALAAGRPVVISDRTPWKHLESLGVGADFPLEKPHQFTEFLQTFVDMEQPDFDRQSQTAREYAIKVADNPEQLEKNASLIEELIRKDKI